MTCTPTKLKDCFIIKPRIIQDNRGYFFESFNEKIFKELMGCQIPFVQDNQSFSFKNTLRGLHLQTGKFEQAKLVRVISGSVLDIAVDLRKNSDSFGKHITVELSSENKKQLLIPRGFAHGFLALSDTVEVLYKCDNLYNKDSEIGIIYNDKTLNINWGINKNDIIISEKDKTLPCFNPSDF